MEYPNEMINDLFKAIFLSKRWMLLEFDWSYSTDVKQFEIEFWNKRQYSYGIIGNGRLALLETEINGRELPPHAFSYNQNLGLLEGVNDLRVYRNSFNRTVIQDSTKHYFRIRDRDAYGRASMTLVNIKGYDAFKFQLEFDERNRIVKRKVSIGTQSMTETLTYNPEGSLVQVWNNNHLPIMIVDIMDYR